MAHRLNAGGRLIDRSKTVAFDFNGKKLTGYQGDTLASALLANDKPLMGRSFKYHRPRGVVASGFEEPNALMTTGAGNGAALSKVTRFEDAECPCEAGERQRGDEDDRKVDAELGRRFSR